MEEKEKTGGTKDYVLRTLLPLILGGVLTLSGSLLNANLSRKDKTLSELRTAYSQFFSETDTINNEVGLYYRSIYSVFDKYYSERKFAGKTLQSSDRTLLENSHKQNLDLQRRIRKHCFAILLLEPSEDFRKGIIKYLESTTDYLEKCDRLAGLLPDRFDYDFELAKELEQKGTLIQELGQLDASYENQLHGFNDFVDTVIKSKRWQD